MGLPSSFQAGTMGYMIDRIDDEIARSGTLNTQIQNAINDSVLIYQKVRLRFNETFTASFTTVGGQQNYTAISDANFPNIAGPQQFFCIDWLTITVGFAVFDVPRIQPEELLILTQTGTQMGQPYVYAFDNETIMLYPVPSTGTQGSIATFNNLIGGTGYTNGNYSNVALQAVTGNGVGGTVSILVVAGQVASVTLQNPGQNYQVGDIQTAVGFGAGSGFNITVATLGSGFGPYTMTVGGHVAYAPPPTLSTAGNRWFTDAERLIRSRAKYELAMHVLNDSDLALRMSPLDPQAGQQPGMAWLSYRELRGEGNRMTARGVIRPMYF